MTHRDSAWKSRDGDADASLSEPATKTASRRFVRSHDATHSHSRVSADMHSVDTLTLPGGIPAFASATSLITERRYV